MPGMMILLHGLYVYCSKIEETSGIISLDKAHPSMKYFLKFYKNETAIDSNSIY
jgi:hypothetical protein